MIEVQVRTSDYYTASLPIIIFDCLYSDIKRIYTVPDLLVGERNQAQLFQGVISIWDEFTKENISLFGVSYEGE